MSSPNSRYSTRKHLSPNEVRASRDAVRQGEKAAWEAAGIPYPYRPPQAQAQAQAQAEQQATSGGRRRRTRKNKRKTRRRHHAK